MLLSIRYSTLYIAVFFLSVVIVSAFCFWSNRDYLFLGLDGKYTYTVLRESAEHLVEHPADLFGFQGNLLQGLGGVGFTLGAPFMPSMWPAAFGADFDLSRVGTFVLLAIEFLLATSLILRALGVNVYLSVFAFSLTLIAMLPYRTFPALFMITSVSPPYGEALFQTVIFIYAFSRIGAGGGRFREVARFAATGLIASIMVCSNPNIVALAPPVCVLYAMILTIVDAPRRRARLWAIAGLAVLMCATTLLPFLLGLMANSAAILASKELADGRIGTKFMSILFNPNIYGDTHQIGFGLFCFATAGSLISVFSRDLTVRGIAIATLLILCATATLGAISTYHPDFNSFWRGPAPIYYELLLVPIYAGLSVRGIQVVCSSAWRLASSKGLVDLGYLQRGVSRNILAAGGLLLAAAAFPILLGNVPIATARINQAMVGQYYKMPPGRNEIVDVLSREIALSPAATYNGRVASLFGMTNQQPFKVADWQIFLRDFEGPAGNDLMTVGMWYFRIPTLLTYNPQMSAAFFRFTKHFFTRPDDVAERGFTVFRKFDARMMRLIGVKFIITEQRDIPLSDARLRASFSVPNVVTANLFELDRVNTKGFSPTRLHTISSWSETLNALDDLNLDLEKDAISDRDLEGPFTPSTQSEITIRGSRIHVKATSEGRSLLVLPFEFSNCIDIDGGPPDLRLFRADGILTGLRFDKSLDIEMSFRFGPGSNALCRLKDAIEHRRATN
jgi:hypothetical protein